MTKKTLDVQIPRPHPKQAEIIDSTARFRVLACGRRFGKTELVIYEIMHDAIRGKRVAYFAPSYKMMSEVWRELKWRLRNVLTHVNQNEGYMRLVTGGLIDFWSLQTSTAESVRGRKYHKIAVDEAAMIPILEIIWNEVAQPLLVDYEGGALFCSTPKGRNFFYSLYALGLDPTQPDWACWNFPTVANPYIKPPEVERARRNTAERSFRQEYLAEFVDDAGAVFRGVGAVSILQPQAGPLASERYVLGVDWGRDIDFTVISVLESTRLRQVHVERFNQIGWSLQRGRLQKLVDHWQPWLILAEANSIGGPNIEALQQEGLPVQPYTVTSANKAPLIEGLALKIERGEIVLLDDPVQQHELKAYTMSRTATGRYTYSAPEGGHDDTVMALALSLEAAFGSQVVVMRQAKAVWNRRSFGVDE